MLRVVRRVRLLFHKLKDLFMIMPIGISYRWAECFCANFPTLSLWLNIVAFPRRRGAACLPACAVTADTPAGSDAGGSAFRPLWRRIRLTDAGEIWLGMRVARYASLRKVGAPYCMTQKISSTVNSALL